MEEIIKIILSIAGVSGVIYMAFDRLEKLAGDQLRKKVLLFIKGQIEDKPIQQFSSLLDHLFGHKHFSWRCFLVSSLVSTIAVSAVYAVLQLLDLGAKPHGVAIVNIIAGALVFNFIPDYISLWESRVIMRWLPRFKALGKALLLILDFIITFAIFVSFYIGLLVSTNIEVLKETEYSVFIKSLLEGNQAPRMMLATFISTFSTSLWIYLYLFGVGAAIMTRKWTPGIKLLQMLKWEDQPIRAIGSIAALYLFVLLCVVQTVFWLIS